jgi:hypothetical protein
MCRVQVLFGDVFEILSVICTISAGVNGKSVNIKDARIVSFHKSTQIILIRTHIFRSFVVWKNVMQSWVFRSLLDGRSLQDVIMQLDLNPGRYVSTPCPRSQGFFKQNICYVIITN